MCLLSIDMKSKHLDSLLLGADEPRVNGLFCAARDVDIPSVSELVDWKAINGC